MDSFYYQFKLGTDVATEVTVPVSPFSFQIDLFKYYGMDTIRFTSVSEEHLN